MQKMQKRQIMITYEVWECFYNDLFAKVNSVKLDLEAAIKLAKSEQERNINPFVNYIIIAVGWD
jgi:hypothetical protein